MTDIKRRSRSVHKLHFTSRECGATQKLRSDEKSDEKDTHSLVKSLKKGVIILKCIIEKLTALARLFLIVLKELRNCVKVYFFVYTVGG